MAARSAGRRNVRSLLAYVFAAGQLLTDSRDLLAVELHALLAQAELHVLVARLAAEYRQRLLDSSRDADDLHVSRLLLGRVHVPVALRGVILVSGLLLRHDRSPSLSMNSLPK